MGRVRVLSLCLTVALAAGVARAQEAAAPAAKDQAEAPPEPLAIELEDVSVRAEAVSAELETLLAATAPPEKDGSAEELEKLLSSGRQRIREIREAIATHPKVQTLEELERQIQALQVPLEERDRSLERRVKAAASSLEKVEALAGVWKKTAQAAGGASRATLDRIQLTRDEIGRARRTLIQRRNDLLTRRDALVDPRGLLDTLLKEVRAAKEERLGDVFSSTRDPIWSASVGEALERELREGLGDSLGTRLEDLRLYAIEKQNVLGFELFLFVGLVAGMHGLRSRVRRESEHHDDLSEAAQVFELPTAMALVIALSISPQLHPLAPPLFNRLTGVISVVPAVLIVRRLVPPSMKPLVVGLLVFFVADRVRDVVSTLPTLERMILVAEMIGALSFLLWLRRPSRLAKLSPEMLAHPTFHTMGMAIRAALPILAIALAADVIGFADLADLLGTAVLRSAYYAVFVYAVTAVLQSLAAYLLLVRPLRLVRGIARSRSRVRQRIDRVLRTGGLLVWLYIVLTIFGIADIGLEVAATVLGFGISVGALSISLGGVLVFVLTVWVTFLLARFINWVLEEDVYPRVRLARGVPYAVSSLVRYGIIVLGFIAALAATGIELSKLTVVIGGLGVGIGFGLQTVVNNFVSGLILLFERPLQVGDTVQLPNLWGEIRRIGIRASVIRTFDGAEVSVPNGLLVADPVTNWTLSDRRRRVEVNVGVEYGTDAQRVIDLLLEVARENPNVIQDPEPRAFFVNFGDSALEFMLRCWLSDFDLGYTVRSELAVAIQKALKEADIGVPFPQRDLHVKTVTPEAAQKLGGPSAQGGEAAAQRAERERSSEG